MKKLSNKTEALPPLDPPDHKRCQADIPNDYSFMTLGGVPGRTRCTRKPTLIATENSCGEDGRIGSMSLCDDCAAVFQKMFPGKASIERI